MTLRGLRIVRGPVVPDLEKIYDPRRLRLGIRGLHGFIGQFLAGRSQPRREPNFGLKFWAEADMDDFFIYEGTFLIFTTAQTRL